MQEDAMGGYEAYEQEMKRRVQQGEVYGKASSMTSQGDAAKSNAQEDKAVQQARVRWIKKCPNATSWNSSGSKSSQNWRISRRKRRDAILAGNMAHTH